MEIEIDETIVKKEKRENPWLVHVKTVRESHPELSYKDILKEAKETYKRKSKKKKSKKLIL